MASNSEAPSENFRRVIRFVWSQSDFLHTIKMLCVVCNLRTGNDLIWSLFSYLEKSGEFDGFRNFFQHITGNDRCPIIEGGMSIGKEISKQTQLK